MKNCPEDYSITYKDLRRKDQGKANLRWIILGGAVLMIVFIIIPIGLFLLNLLLEYYSFLFNFLIKYA